MAKFRFFKSIFFSLVFIIFVSSCQENGRNLNNGPTGSSLPNNNRNQNDKCALKKPCNDFLKINNQVEGFCFLDGQNCVLAEECGQIPLNSCLSIHNSQIKGKRCLTVNSRCTEVFDCNSLTQSNCEGKLSQADPNTESCSWFERAGAGKCYSTSKTTHFTSRLYGSNGTVCTYASRHNIPEEIECFGDNANGKLPVNFGAFAHRKPRSILFADDFGCAEMESDDQVVCWGSNTHVVGQEPTQKVKANSLRVNNHVACAIIDDPAHPNHVKCWGDLTQLVTTNPLFLRNLKFDKPGDEGFVYLGDNIGHHLVQAKKIALGEDFLCVAISPTSLSLGAYQNQLLCSGKTNFEEFLNIPNITNEIDDLSAGEDFACLLKSSGINSSQASCFKQAGNRTNFINNLIFGAQYSGVANRFEWIQAQSKYMCGWRLSGANPHLACFDSQSAAPPALLTSVDTMTFLELKVSFTFGSSNFCGIIDSKIKCLGPATLINGIPKFLSAP